MKKTGLLFVFMIFCSIVSGFATKVNIYKNKSSISRPRSIQSEPSSLSVNLESDLICVDFSFIVREVNLSIVDSEGRQVYQEVVSPQTSSTTINLQDQDPGEYTIYFTDATGVCLFGSFVIQ